MTGTLTRLLGELRFESGVPGGSEATEIGEEVEKVPAAYDHGRDITTTCRHPTNRGYVTNAIVP